MLACAVGGCAGRAKSESGKSEPPAKVEKHPEEADVYRITLTPKAVKRLGITTARVERKSVRRHRTLGGEVVIPTGSSIIVSAPLPGTLSDPKGGRVPAPGARVEAGQPIFSFTPLLSPEREAPTAAERVQMANARASLVSSQITADGDVKHAREQVKAAAVALGRAEQLLKDKAGSVRAVDEARAAWSLAQKTMEAAEARKGLLDALTLDAEKGELRTLEITSPEAGILRRLSATRGQTVSTGAALFEVVNLDTVWMRVPVYVGCLSEIESGALAIVGPLNGGASPSSPTAKPIAAPPSADALSSTVDLYYEISNREGALRPGERVGVTLALKGESSNLTAPWAAVLHDIHGVAWVYEKTADHVFQRRRVLVQHVVGDLAVLGSGPKPGTEIVVDGAAELFGTEFGAGK